MVQRRPIRSAVGVIAAAVLLAGTVTACSAGGADGAVEISYSVNNDETSISGARPTGLSTTEGRAAREAYERDWRTRHARRVKDGLP